MGTNWVKQVLEELAQPGEALELVGTTVRRGAAAIALPTMQLTAVEYFDWLCEAVAILRVEVPSSL
jgi:hypothetical protein